MCGLVGAFRANKQHWTKIVNFMQQGLYMSGLRGMHGTGCGLVFDDFGTEYAKTHSPSYNFINSEEWEWVEKHLYQTRAVLGHTRHSTLGKVSGNNSHPFRMKDDNNEILLMHNGHVRNYKSLTPNTFNHDVDSAHVAHSILKRGGIPTLEMLEGAYTLIWYDRNEKSMFIARNEDRDLYYALNKDETKFYFASEIDFLISLLRRNQIEYEDDFFQLPQYTLHKFDLTKEKLVPTTQEYEEKKYQPASYANLYDWNGGGQKEENHNSYIKPTPTTGDRIWCRVEGDVAQALTLYKPIGEGEGEVGEEEAYGYVYGKRSMEPGAVIRVNGINYKLWHEKYQYIADSLPIKITRVDRKALKVEGKEFPLYEGLLEIEAADRDFVTYGLPKKKSIEEIKKRKEYEEALASGRAVPAPVQPSAEKDSKLRSGNAGAGVGSDDGTSLGIIGLALDKYPVIYAPGPNGRNITVKEWREIAVQGCLFCHGKCELDLDKGKVQFFELPRNPEDRNDHDAEYRMICPSCCDDPKQMEKIAAA